MLLLHLTSDYLMSITKRPLSRQYIVSAACHSLEQLMKAQAIGVDFATLSPILKTKTHPDSKPLGWDLFAKLCHSTTVPIYALGGLSNDDLEKPVSLGAYGIAGISFLWGML